MNLFYRAALILAMIVLAHLRAGAQIIPFPETPCDSASCDSIVIPNGPDANQLVRSVTFRDGTSFSVPATAPTLPFTIPPNGRLALPLCFSPERRGPITDSIAIVLERQGKLDTLRRRLIGRGVGPEIVATPTVLNFPKTNPTFSASLRIWFSNVGERPHTIAPGDLNVPAPFSVVTPLPVTIPPNDSVEIEFSFEPTDKGVFSVPYLMPAGCTFKLQLGLNGTTDIIGTGAVLRVTKVGFNPANREQIRCDVSRCTDVTLANVGNATLTVESLQWLLGTNGYTITTPIPTPFLMAPNSTKVLTVCLENSGRGKIRDTLVVTSNTRSSIAFGLVADESGSMQEDMECDGSPVRKIVQARAQATAFVGNTLLYLPAIGIQDQIAISRYNQNTSPQHIYPLTNVTDLTRQEAQDAVGTLAAFPGRGTRTGRALRWMMDTLAKSPLANRVIVLLTDGMTDDIDELNFPVQTIVNEANRRGIRIFTVGIAMPPEGRTYLSRIANGTGGAPFDAGDCDSLQQAFEAITDIISRGSVTREPFAITVTAPVVLLSETVTFDSTYKHFTTCRTVELSNAGEGDAIIDTATFEDLFGGTSEEFTFDAATTFPIRIPEAESKQITLCFTPDSIRVRRGRVSLTYNGCDIPAATAEMAGPGFAAANLRITDNVVGLPGTTVMMPVHFDSSLAGYSVGTVIYRARWNNSMLDLRGVRPGSSAPGSSVVVSGPVQVSEGVAEAEFTVTGGLIGPGELAQIEFQVLRGDSLASTVALTGGKFQDDNPRTILTNSGMIAYDSTCFRDGKSLAVDNPAAKVTVGEIAPNPITGRVVTLTFDASEATSVHVALFAHDGTLTLPETPHGLAAGANALTLDLTPVTAGSYWARVRTTAGETIFRRILVVR